MCPGQKSPAAHPPFLPLPPLQHLLELVVFNALFLPFIWWLLQRPLVVDVPALPSGHAASKGTAALASRARAHHWALAALDTVCTSIVWVTGLLTVYFKLREDCMGRPRLAYLLQPCHLSNFALCVMTFMRATPTTTWLFEFYLVTVFGALCALATPDMRGLDLFPFGWPGWEGYTGEKVSFVVQHVLLLVVPAIWIARRRFALAKPPTADWRGCATMWAVFSAIHWDVFAPIGYLTGHNINYMLVPPEGPLWVFGKYYRLAMLLACLVFSFVMRMSAWLRRAREGACAVGPELSFDPTHSNKPLCLTLSTCSF